MKFAPLDPSIGAEVLFYDPQRREPMTLRRAQLAGKSTTSTGWHLLVFNDPEIDVKSDRRDPTEIAYDVELIASAEKVPSPIARVCWPWRPDEVWTSPAPAPPDPRGLTKAPGAGGPASSQGKEGHPSSTLGEDPAAPVDMRAEFSAGRLDPQMPAPDGRPHILEGPSGRCFVAATKKAGDGARFAALDQDGESGALRWVETIDEAHIFETRKLAIKAAGMMPAAFIAPITVPSRGKGRR